MLDTLGALLLGSLPKYSASRLTGDLAKNLGGVPECTLIGRGFKTSVANAALANGVIGYAADVEGGGVWRQHAAAVLVPTAHEESAIGLKCLGIAVVAPMVGTIAISASSSPASINGKTSPALSQAPIPALRSRRRRP